MEFQEGDQRCVQGLGDPLSASADSGVHGAKEWSGTALLSSSPRQNCASSLMLREAPHLCVCQHRGVGFRRRRGSSPSQQTF